MVLMTIYKPMFVTTDFDILMKIISRSNFSLGPKASRAIGDRISESNLQHAEVACFQLASVKKRSIPAKLGLKHSAQILLDIIKAAQVIGSVSPMRNHY
jgi:hypothetical protein